jgi:sugar phosphate isomerase/epimerase
MKIKYVVSSMVFWGCENNLTFEQDCEFLRSLGFGIELWPNEGGLNACKYDRRNWKRLSHATKEMLVSMRSRNDNPTLEQWQEQIQCAEMLDSRIVTDLRSFGIPEGEDLNGRDLPRQIVEMAQQSNVRLCIETGSLKQVKQLGKKFDSIGYCLDTGFANLDKNVGFKKYVDELAERITHLHINDNYGRTNDHAPPGLAGGISRQNWDYLLEALNRYDNEIIACLEMRPPSPTCIIRQASDFLFDHLNWPDKPRSSEDRPARNRIPAKNR